MNYILVCYFIVYEVTFEIIISGIATSQVKKTYFHVCNYIYMETD